MKICFSSTVAMESAGIAHPAYTFYPPITEREKEKKREESAEEEEEEEEEIGEEEERDDDDEVKEVKGRKGEKREKGEEEIGKDTTALEFKPNSQRLFAIETITTYSSPFCFTSISNSSMA